MEVFTGIFAIVMGLFALWFSAKFMKLYFKVKAWEKVEANVISKSISMHEKFSTARTPYKLNAIYKYRFNNEEFTGNFIYLVEFDKAGTPELKKFFKDQMNELKTVRHDLKTRLPPPRVNSACQLG